MRYAQKTVYFFPSKHMRLRALDHIHYRLTNEEKGPEFQFLHNMDEWYTAQLIGDELPSLDFMSSVSCIPRQKYNEFKTEEKQGWGSKASVNTGKKSMKKEIPEEQIETLHNNPTVIFNQYLHLAEQMMTFRN